jgi:hypothetical protein
MKTFDFTKKLEAGAGFSHINKFILDRYESVKNIIGKICLKNSILLLLQSEKRKIG